MSAFDVLVIVAGAATLAIGGFLATVALSVAIIEAWRGRA